MNNFTKVRKYATKLAGVLACVVQCGCITHCATEYVGDFALCTGPSMEPTLYSDNLIFSEHITPLQNFKRGDIVIARSPTHPRQYICKRVVGLPGDRVHTGSYIDIVPIGHVWLAGDNIDNSKDSREYGPVPQGLIQGRAVCRIWPIKDFKMLTNSEKESQKLQFR